MGRKAYRVSLRQPGRRTIIHNDSCGDPAFFCRLLCCSGGCHRHALSTNQENRYHESIRKIHNLAVFVEFLASAGLAVFFHLVLHKPDVAYVIFGVGILLSLATTCLREDIEKKPPKPFGTVLPCP